MSEDNSNRRVALYARVSTENQDLERQEQKLVSWAEHNNYKYELFSEKVSSIKDRPKFEEIMAKLEDFDVLAVTKVDRFGRSLQDILQKVNTLKEHDVDFVTIDQPINTEDEMMGDLMMKMLAIFAEFERKMIRKRLQEGYKEALDAGKVGRPNKLSDEDVDFVVKQYENGASYEYIRYLLSSRRGLDVSRTTVYRALKSRGVVGGEAS